MKQNANCRTDLAEESCQGLHPSVNRRGIVFQETIENNISLSRLQIETEEGAAILGKPIGQYLTVHVGKIWEESDERYRQIESFLSNELRTLSKSLVPALDHVLIVGLGNRSITSDAIGPHTVDLITVTRHLRNENKHLYSLLGDCSLSGFSPGVIGQTGIETVELISGAVDHCQPHLVIVIDALAAGDINRLATTVQFSDTGIEPGSGIGNRRKAINRNTLGVPVISIGVPMVVDSSTLVSEMLAEAHVTPSPSLEEALSNGRSFFVTPKDVDVADREMAKLLAGVINQAFLSRA